MVNALYSWPKRPKADIELTDMTMDALEERESKGLHRTNETDGGYLPCPWCGEGHGDLFEMSEGDGHECGSCGGEYSIEREAWAIHRATRTKLPLFLCREGDELEECEVEVGSDGYPCPPMTPSAAADHAGIAADPCGPALGPAGLVCAGAFFQPQPVAAPLWNGEPAPATWEAFVWPAWVPESVRERIEGKARHRSNQDTPAQWLAQAARHGMPAFGAWLTLPREQAHSREPGSHAVLDTITGRFVPSPNNGCTAGYLVHRDGRATMFWSIPTNPAPWVQEYGFRHRPRRDER